MFRMTDYDYYVFFLCLIVFVALTAFFTLLICYIVRLTIKLIRAGCEDEEIKKEYLITSKSKSKGNGARRIISVFCSLAFIALMIFCVGLNLTKKPQHENIPVLYAVKSDSMSEKAETNTYLTEHRLDNQFQMFDLVLTYKLPKEDQLKLYDVVVYEVKGVEIIHRIVGIEEPNEKHPNERWFTFQGDAVDSPDYSVVTYDQMKSIYLGDRLPFVGSFIMFMQSPSGWLCILLIILTMVASPLVEKKINKERELRFKSIKANALLDDVKGDFS